MQDRVSQYPGRVKLTPVSGQENVYDMEWADGATVAGTALNKANLLSDSTATAFGLTSSATVNTTLAKARELISNAQNTANSALSWDWSKLGTANITGISFTYSAPASFSINVSSNLSNFANIMIVFDNIKASGGGAINVFGFRFSCSSESRSCLIYTPDISFEYGKTVYTIFTNDGTDNIDGRLSDSVVGKSISGTITTSSGSTITITSGTITVYGRGNKT